ncbi:outer dense fiber protein 3-B-like [Macrosteles quadrilineatus]|uniref:outer dense fiber protein 3-B-like n=1 Tax=Macrosteles quadrilineatus TaxID=74068 RepID=UPI0023E1B8B9|nr:outer dense fiber protein 3-B-like [Macrosteles quadrilineatus]
MVKGGPAPNVYALPTTVGTRRHDPTKLMGPAFSFRPKLEQGKFSLGPGLYNITGKTRHGPARGPAYTVRAKLPDLSRHYVPAPTQYRPEKYLHQKHNPPKFTMVGRTKPLKPEYIPAPNTYKLPFRFGQPEPNKHYHGPYTMGARINTPNKVGNPAPNRYGPVAPDIYKPAAAKYTMRANTSLLKNRTQKPAPNSYFPKLKGKENPSKFSFRQRDVDGRVIYFTIDDIKQR